MLRSVYTAQPPQDISLIALPVNPPQKLSRTNTHSHSCVYWRVSEQPNHCDMRLYMTRARTGVEHSRWLALVASSSQSQSEIEDARFAVNKKKKEEEEANRTPSSVAAKCCKCLKNNKN